MKQKIKLGIILGVEFVAIAVILFLIFFAGKKSYTVTFDLNGGTLLSGELVQDVPQGKNATPPNVAKEGCYLHSWSASYRYVTRDIVIEAVWEWETSIGFDYVSSEDSNYCEITGCFRDLVGDVYVGVYHNEKKVLGIRDEAFRDRDGITYIHMLDGILSIGDSVFRDCDSLVSVELPGTLTKLGESAFEDCVSLERVVLPENLEIIPERAFANCVSLKEIVIPSCVKTISASAFIGCESLESIVFEVEEVVEVDEETEEQVVVDILGLENIGTLAFWGCSSLEEVILPETVMNVDLLAFDSTVLTIKTPLKEEEKPLGWVSNCFGSSNVEWGFVPSEDEEKDEKSGWLS